MTDPVVEFCVLTGGVLGCWAILDKKFPKEVLHIRVVRATAADEGGEAEDDSHVKGKGKGNISLASYSSSSSSSSSRSSKMGSTKNGGKGDGANNPTSILGILIPTDKIGRVLDVLKTHENETTAMIQNQLNAFKNTQPQLPPPSMMSHLSVPMLVDGQPAPEQHRQ